MDREMSSGTVKAIAHKLIKSKKLRKLFEFLVENPQFSKHVFNIAAERDIEIFELLEKNFPYKPNSEDVYYVVRKSDPSYVKYFFEKYNIKNHPKYITAAFNRNNAAVKDFILSLPKDSKSLDMVFGMSVQHGHEKEVEKLLEENKFRQTALDAYLITAAKTGNAKIVKALLERGANPSIHDNIAFIEAYKNKHFEIAKKLFERLENPNTAEILRLFELAFVEYKLTDNPSVFVFLKNHKFTPEDKKRIIRDQGSALVLLSTNVSLENVVFVGFNDIRKDKVAQYFKNLVNIHSLRRELEKLNKLNDELLSLIENEELMSSAEIKLFEKQFQVLDVLRGQFRNKMEELKNENESYKVREEE